MPAVQPCAGIRLRDVLPLARCCGGDIRVRSLATELRDVQPGDLFVAIEHPGRDGHDDAGDAVARGAVAVLAERLLPLSVPVAVVDDSREALGLLCQALVGRPADALRTIGISGSLGKTVTAMLIASILEAADRPTGVISSLGCSDSVDQEVGNRPTPHAPELAHWLARTQESGARDCVIEISSRAAAERRIAGVAFDVALLTNIRRDSAELHGSQVNYSRAQRRVIDQLKPGGLAVINADDPGCRALLDILPCPVLTFGRNLEANITAEILERHSSEQIFMLHAGEQTAIVRTQMIGDQHVSNCLAAATVGLALGIDLPTIVRGLEKVVFVPGRMERLECGQPFRVFVDGGRTPDALAVALKTARQAATGRVLCVFGCPGGKDKNQRPWMGRVAERAADLVVLTSDDPRHEEPLQIAHDILDGCEYPGKPHVIPSRDKAIRWALSQARPGDVVVIAGKGDRLTQHTGSEKVAWSDREIACEWLYENDLPTILPFRRLVPSNIAN